jgi:nucleoid DNA-binding protein
MTEDRTMKTKTPPATQGKTKGKKTAKAVESPKGVNGVAKVAKGASHWGLANRLRDRYPAIFLTKIAAKQLVDAVLETAGEILTEEGYLCLRGVGTIRASKGTERKDDKTGRPPKAARRRLSISTSWAMLDRLNPENPKRKKKR